MGAVAVDGANGEAVGSVEQMFGRFSAELIHQFPAWRKRLADRPDQLSELETDVHAACMRGADMIICGLVAIVLQSHELAVASEQTRLNFREPLARGRNRSIRVRLLSGFTMWVSSLYCEPEKSLAQREKRPATGLYIELAQFGFGKGITPGLQSKVARQSALSPSLDKAREELVRGGLKINVKTVRRISNQCGDDLLKLRKTWLMQWRAGKLAAGDELHGKRVSVQIDGGRTKIRQTLRELAPQLEPVNEAGEVIENVPGRSRARAKRTFASEWREPKLVTIFVHDEHGRMEKKTQATIDGTFAGPDAICELVAMHLHRLGAAKATSITFACDGAPWIWDRIDRMVELAKIEKTVAIHQVLDNCHAAHHISLALAALGLNEQERMPLYRELRTKLRNGQWRAVVELLEELLEAFPLAEGMRTEIAYLRKHGEAKRLNYVYYRSLGIPLGSGAIESSIRRVINTRLKNNGTFWLEKNAENMLQLRALATTGRWDKQLYAMQSMNRTLYEADWTWVPQNMSSKKLEPSNTTLS